MELTNSLRKLIISLADARHRKEHGLFTAEGTKCVLDTWNGFSCHSLFATAAWCEKYISSLEGAEPTIVKKSDLERISSLSTPAQVIAVYRIPEYNPDYNALESQLSIALDCVQNPGNLGTIMRVADWMGVTTILASNDTVDVWNPKVIQATMGAVSRVKVHYVDLHETLGSIKGIPVCGTFLDGENIYESQLPGNGIIVMGNEGKGISEEIASLVTKRLYIPSFPPERPTSESLNVAIATAITLAEFRRRQS